MEVPGEGCVTSLPISSAYSNTHKHKTYIYMYTTPYIAGQLHVPMHEGCTNAATDSVMHD